MYDIVSVDREVVFASRPLAINVIDNINYTQGSGGLRSAKNKIWRARRRFADTQNGGCSLASDRFLPADSSNKNTRKKTWHLQNGLLEKVKKSAKRYTYVYIIYAKETEKRWKNIDIEND